MESMVFSRVAGGNAWDSAETKTRAVTGGHRADPHPAHITQNDDRLGVARREERVEPDQPPVRGREVHAIVEQPDHIALVKLDLQRAAQYPAALGWWRAARAREGEEEVVGGDQSARKLGEWTRAGKPVVGVGVEQPADRDGRRGARFGS